MRVLCVTPNVSVDRVVTVPGFAAGGVWRAQSVHAVCGGKGVNVARAVRRLGHDALCAGPIAGHAGRYAAEQAAAEGLNACWTVGPGETRTCTIVVHDGASTVINEPGSALPRQDWRRLVEEVVRAAHDADVVAISGSLPANCPPEAIAELISGAFRNALVWTDTSGAALAAAVACGFGAIKINADEAADLLGRPVSDVDDGVAAARAIHERSGGIVAITMGAAGAVLVHGADAWHAEPPAVDVVSPTGSGDSFLAGLVTAPAGDWPGALRRATAAGTADALQPTAGALDPADVERIAAATTVVRLEP